MTEPKTKPRKTKAEAAAEKATAEAAPPEKNPWLEQLAEQYGNERELLTRLEEQIAQAQTERQQRIGRLGLLAEQIEEAGGPSIQATPSEGAQAAEEVAEASANGSEPDDG